LTGITQVTTANLWTTLAIQSKAAPYKATLLCVLMFVFLVVVGRLIWGGPQSAEAALPTGPIAVVPASWVTQPSAAKAAPPAAGRPALPELPDTAARDLFYADWLVAARPNAPDVAATAHAQPDRGESSEAGKAGELVLELTFTGAVDARQHCAVISGKRVRPGDAIRGYVVESITPSLVVLTTPRGDRMLLRMN